MIVLAVTYVIKSGHEDEAVRHLIALEEATRQEPGNLMYVVHRAKDDPRTFFIYEQYVDEAALEAHRQTPHFNAHGPGGLMPLAESRSPALYVPLT
jgi:(4S)-4-hydroxy-5-phosphonooxypentane-2,3-dione isomerase